MSGLALTSANYHKTSISSVAIFVALGIESDSYSGLLCPVVLSKIPADLKLIIHKADWKLDI